MRRFAYVALLVVFLLGAFVPSSSAAVEANVLFTGVGAARGLDLSLPLLNVLPASLAQNFKGLTVGLTSATFSGLANPRAQGLAIGDCSLLASGISLPNLPVLPCSGDAMETSATDGDNGDGQQKCRSALTLAIVNLVTSCANSVSQLVSGRPVSQNFGGVADLNIPLDLNLLNALNLPLDLPVNQQQVVDTVLGLVNQVLTVVPSIPALSPVQETQLTDQVTQLLNTIVQNVGKLATVKAGLSTTEVTSQGVVTTVVSQAAGAKIGLLGITNALTDGLVIVDVSAAKATAVWNDATGQAEAFATPALATVKVKDLLGLTNSPDGYLTIPVELPNLNGLLAPLAGSILGDILQIELASATPKQVGNNVSAVATGLGIRALTGLGASAPGAKDGGLSLKLATANVGISGDIVKAQEAAPALPITGGPIFGYLAGAAIMAVGAPVLYRAARRIRRGEG